MRSQITGLETAEKNSNDAISLVQTAEGALTEVHTMLNRMVEIATQSANGVYDDNVDRAALQDELNSLRDEIDRIADGTNFNKQNLLDGGLSTAYTGEVYAAANGANAGVDLTVAVNGAMSGAAIEINLAVTNKAGAEASAAAGSDGAITITLVAGEDYTADEIADLIKNATFDGTSDANKADWEEITSSITVAGQGITADSGDTGLAVAQVTTTAADAENEELSLQIGDTNDDFNKLKVAIRDMHSDALGLENISIDNQDDAGNAIGAINAAINLVSTQRGELGAVQNRLEHTINNLNVNVENMTAAESRIRDVDMAEEMMAYTKNNILVQASQAMLAQANQVPQGVLQLLQ